MAKVQDAMVVGLKAFKSKKTGQEYFLINVLFEDPEMTAGMNCANVFINEDEFKELLGTWRSTDGDGVTISIFCVGGRVEYVK